jgi:hypothetical protein
LTKNASQSSINQQIVPLIEERNLSELPGPPLLQSEAAKETVRRERNFAATKCFALICLILVSSVACSAESALGAMKAFRELCLGSNPSIDVVSEAAKLRHYKLLIDRTISGSEIRQKSWFVEDETGGFSLILTQNNSKRVMCGVTFTKRNKIGSGNRTYGIVPLWTAGLASTTHGWYYIAAMGKKV